MHLECYTEITLRFSKREEYCNIGNSRRSNDCHFELNNSSTLPFLLSFFFLDYQSIFSDSNSAVSTPLFFYPFNFLTALQRRGSIRPTALHSRSPPRRFDQERKRATGEREGGGEREKKGRSTPAKWSEGPRVGPQASRQSCSTP